MLNYLEFEKQIEIIDKKISSQENLSDKITIENLNNERNLIIKKIYSKLTSWQKVQIARHPNRPHANDYIKNISNKFDI